MMEEQDRQTQSVLEASFFEHRPRLLSFLRHAGAGDQAEDLLQEAWLKVSSASEAQAEIVEPRSYLFRLVHNLVLDWRRGELRTRRRNEAWADATGSAVPGVCDEPVGERVLIARATLAAAQRVLTELGEPTAGIFRLHRLGGMTQRRIAEELGIGLSTVEKHLRRAYRAMNDLAEALDD